MSSLYLRKLQALSHPEPLKINFNDDNEFRNLIVWLEDQKIRHYKIEDRAALRNTPAPEWTKAFESYVEDLGCPYSISQKNAVLDWLLGYAVRLEYGDDVEKYKAVSPQAVKQKAADPAGGASSNPLDNLDFNDPDFKAGVTSLAMMLQIPPYNDHLEQLKAICILVKEKLSKEVLEKAGTKPSTNQTIPLERTELGFDTGDYIINEAAKILRLLHIRDLRELQSTINQAIVAVQAIIANPKTDSRLGKVGR